MSSRSNEAGFSLVESLAALAVFALAGVGLVVLQSHSLRTLSQIEERAIAEVVAQNALVSALAAREPPVLGVTTTQEDAAGRTWGVMRTVSETQDSGALRVEVSVAPAGSRAVATTVRGFAVRQSRDGS